MSEVEIEVLCRENAEQHVLIAKLIEQVAKLNERAPSWSLSRSDSSGSLWPQSRRSPGLRS